MRAIISQMNVGETDLAESFEGEEGGATDFPLSGAWWDSVFILLLSWEYCTSECVGEAQTIWLTDGGGARREKLGEPRRWETIGWTIYFHPSFSVDFRM
jgi:hypothetical protein